MSMNLHLVWKDKEGLIVGECDLIQTPTKDTYEILGDSEDNEAIFNRYIEWCEKRFGIIKVIIYPAGHDFWIAEDKEDADARCEKQEDGSYAVYSNIAEEQKSMILGYREQFSQFGDPYKEVWMAL